LYINQNLDIKGIKDLNERRRNLTEKS
jgi:hypothetical protein